jgi:hypothetical protein
VIIVLVGRENELLQSWISFSDESMVCLLMPILLTPLSFVESRLQGIDL